ncbi:MAG: hypothetical protein GX096_10000 [Clostridiales bacterium]|nr:hypothetical protein [Clostridiales bacterium]
MLHSLTFLVSAVAVCILAKRKFEVVLAPIMLLLMLVLTGLAMAGSLSLIDTLAPVTLALIALLLIYALVARKITPKEIIHRVFTYVLTPGLVCFAALIAFYYYASGPMIVWWRDDVAHWALEVKSLLIFDGLVDGAHHLNPFFATYTPGISLIQWWFMHIAGEFNEGVLYFSLFSTYTVFLLPLLRDLKWKHFYLIPFAFVFLVILPVWGNVMSYLSLAVDTTLSLCFGYALLEIWRLKDKDSFGLFSIALALCGLVLIKQIGFMLALMIIPMLYVMKKHKGQSKWQLTLCVLSPVIVYLGWMLYCRVMNLSGYHTSGLVGHISNMLSGSYVPSPMAEDVPYAFMHALTMPSTSFITYNTQALVSIPRLALLLLIPLVPLLLSKHHAKHRMRNISITLLCMSLAYLLVQFVSFYTVFYDEVPLYVGENMGNMCLLLERYLAPVVLGTAMLVIGMFIDAFCKKDLSLKKPTHAIGLTAIIAVFLVSTNWDVMNEGLLPEHYFQQARAISVQEQAMMDHYWAEDLEGYENAKVLAGFENNSDFIKDLRYTFAPIYFESPSPDFTASPELLLEHIIQNKITHVICFDDVNMLTSPASELVAEDDELYTWTLYEVTQSEDGILLVEYGY